MIWELLPLVAIGNKGKQRIVNVAEPVCPLVPVHHVSVEPDLDCLPNLPGVLVTFSVQNLRLFPVDHMIICGHVIRDHALVELSLTHRSVMNRDQGVYQLSHIYDPLFASFLLFAVISDGNKGK